MNWTALEAAAAAGNLAYTVLMLYERRVGWLFGIVASAMSCFLFWHQRVYAQVGLNVFYVVMGAYGWWQWGRDRGNRPLPITRRGLKFHVLIAIVCVTTATLLSLGARMLPDPQHVELEASVTAISLLATWMLARKILENWAYWIAADIAAIALYAMLELWWYAGLYAIYVALSAAALRRWSKQTFAAR